MTVSIRLVVLGLVAAVLFGIAWAQPDLLACCGLNFAEISQYQEQEVREQQRRESMDRHHQVILRRIEAKNEVVRELTTGQLSLMQAARRFKDLDETPATCQDDYRRSYPGRSDGEKACRQVLRWVESHLETLTPSQADALRRRLDAEWHEGLRLGGGIVVLPD
jgi:hypothetical protein